MSLLSQQTILETLSSVIDREVGSDVVSLGLISGLAIRGGKVGFLITIAPGEQERKAYLRDACVKAVETLPGVEAVTAVLTAEATPALPERPRTVWNQRKVEGIGRIIAVASGKGGVGKSTTTVGLAHALVARGMRVGLLDADIYGPSIPRMLGLPGSQPAIRDGKMVPPEAHGIKAMSIGLLTGDSAAILRGPMISKSLTQLLRASDWGMLDILLIDMPPGTGDVPLSLAQNVALDGVIIVTTPQEVAVMDARKSLSSFIKLGVKVLGVVENMSYLIDSAGARLDVFGEGGGRRLAEEGGVAFLGEVPLEMGIGQAVEDGRILQNDAYDRMAMQLI